MPAGLVTLPRPRRYRGRSRRVPAAVLSGSFGHALDEHPRLRERLGSSCCAAWIVTRGTGAGCRVQARPSRGHSQRALRGICTRSRGLPRPLRRTSAGILVGGRIRLAEHPSMLRRTGTSVVYDNLARRTGHMDLSRQASARAAPNTWFCPGVRMRVPCAIRAVIYVNGRTNAARPRGSPSERTHASSTRTRALERCMDPPCGGPVAAR